MAIRSLEPVLDAQTRILVLGSMPSEMSLSRGEYYANPRNQFWTIVFSVFDSEPLSGYQAKTQFLLRKGIGLWDVLASCDREGSLDANIRNETVNDFPALFRAYPAIRRVLLNGTKAHDVFMRRFGANCCESVRFFKMPSTSPAHTIPFERKLNEWRMLNSTRPHSDE